MKIPIQSYTWTIEPAQSGMKVTAEIWISLEAAARNPMFAKLPEHQRTVFVMPTDGRETQMPLPAEVGDPVMGHPANQRPSVRFHRRRSETRQLFNDHPRRRLARRKHDRANEFPELRPPHFRTPVINGNLTQKAQKGTKRTRRTIKSFVTIQQTPSREKSPP